MSIELADLDGRPMATAQITDVQQEGLACAVRYVFHQVHGEEDGYLMIVKGPAAEVAELPSTAEDLRSGEGGHTLLTWQTSPTTIFASAPSQ